MYTKNPEIVILGGGLAGLSAGYILSEEGKSLLVIEGNPEVGGLARTITHRGFSFDLGGHRFIARNKDVERFIIDILSGECLLVKRKSRIYMKGRYFDYPLRPANALFGIGILTTLSILMDYCKEKVFFTLRPRVPASLEEWVVSRFGRRMFDLYFKEYSEKVWGIDCSQISAEWVAKRIDGLSLGRAIKKAIMKQEKDKINTLADFFLYPLRGIGEISERLQEGIERENRVLTDTKVAQVYHEDLVVKGVTVRRGGVLYDIEGDAYISSIPLTNLVQMLLPPPPEEVLNAALGLRYRDLIVVAVMLDREQATDLTWMYLPEKDVPFGRIHEPKNWSQAMAPKGKTHIVAEYFCFKGDAMWKASDEDIVSLTVRHLDKIGFIRESEVIDSYVIRVANAYPLFDVEFRSRSNTVMRHLKNFKNLHIIGRSGMFRYLNMDSAIESGIEAAAKILNTSSLKRGVDYQPVSA